MRNEMAETRMVLGRGAVGSLLKSFNLSKNIYSFLKFNKKAFTLAEVLVTLTIIGVVSAITIPTLHKNYKAVQFETAFKKAHSEMAAISKFMVAEQETDDLYGALAKSTAILSTQQGFAKSIETYYKNIKNEPQRAIAGKILDRHGNVKYYRNFSNTANAPSPMFDDGGYELMDGRAIWFEGGFGNVVFMITYDLNGIDQGPNRYGYDLFTFILANNGTFYPAGSKFIEDSGLSYQNCSKALITGKDGCSTSSTSACNGIGCANQAVINHKYFRELKW